MSEQTGELAVVVFTDYGDAGWQPTQVFTREWVKFHSGCEGWRTQMFDGSWCQRDEQLHLYNSGGGIVPYVHPFREPSPPPARIWIADCQAVYDGRNTDGPALTDADLLVMGYQRIHEHPGDIFDGASDEKTVWCEECEDNIPRDVNPCEHLVTCWHCQASYTAEGDEERRCPDCNESQHECDHCNEQGAETCISCGQWICKACWAGHDDDTPTGKCERGAPDWKEPA